MVAKKRLVEVGIEEDEDPLVPVVEEVDNGLDALHRYGEGKSTRRRRLIKHKQRWLYAFVCHKFRDVSYEKSSGVPVTSDPLDSQRTLPHVVVEGNHPRRP